MSSPEPGTSWVDPGRGRGAPRRSSKRIRFEGRLLGHALLVATPGLIAAGLLIGWDTLPPTGEGILLATAGLLTLVLALRLRRAVVYPLQVMANLLEALREGDYSFRARRAGPGDALGEVLLEINRLAESLKQERLHAVEATALLDRVMREIDVAIFAFDGEERLRLVNRAGERLLARERRDALDRDAAELGLAPFLAGESGQTVEHQFPGGSGRWGVRRSRFREEGRTHHLLVIADLSRPLREEERQAWQRLIRVLGHELRNSLTPIKSMAGTLERLLARSPRPDDWEEDAARALDVIAARADALSRFVAGYSRLARLPAPRRQPTEIGPLIRRVVELEDRLEVRVEEGPEVTAKIDPVQVEQLLINLVQNGVEAVLEEGGGEVVVRWEASAPRGLVVVVLDDGPGVSNPENLFVPFFTTKEGGSGIGLVLGRQIAEAHGGTLQLENREKEGARAAVTLPLGKE